MKIAILGSGNVGSALGKSLGAAGHEVVFGSREGKSHSGGVPIDQAVAGAEVVILAVPFAAARDVLAAAGPLQGKVLIDATNPINVQLPDGISGAEHLARAFPAARFVKCFNQTGAENMGGARFPAGRPVMFAAADDEGARKAALQLAADAGFEALPAGPLASARWLEALARVWIHLAYAEGQGRSIAFGILRR